MMVDDGRAGGGGGEAAGAGAAGAGAAGAAGAGGVSLGSAAGRAAAVAGAAGGRVAGFPVSCFLDAEFDAQEFVGKARRSVGLEELLSELQGHLLRLREGLVDAINEDYGAFVGMASSLKGLDSLLSRVRAPVESLRTEMMELRESTAGVLMQLEGKLEERSSILSAQHRLELLLDIEMGLSRMEALLMRDIAEVSEYNEKEEMEDGEIRELSVGELMRGANVLERVSNETARLRGQVLRLDESLDKKDLLHRLDQLQEQLLKRLNGIFGAAISYEGITGSSDGVGRKEAKGSSPFAGREGVIETCMRSYVIAEKVDACQSVIRSECIRPYITSAVTVQNLEMGKSGSCDGLEGMYSDLLQFVDGWCLPLSEHAASALGLRANEEGKLVADESSLEGEEPEVGGQESEIVGWSGATMAKRSFILGNCFFAELSSLLLSVGGRRLTQYLDDVFGRKYHCTMKFLEDLEMRCLNREEAEALRNHVSLQDFLQKWELPLRAFVQLRQQEVSQSLSALLLTPSQLSEAIKERERQAQAGTAAEEDNKDGRENKQDGDPVEEVQEFSAERPPLPTYKEDEHSTSTPFYLKGSSSAWESLTTIWKDPIPSISHRLLQLSLMIIWKFSSWADEWATHLPARIASAEERNGSIPGGSNKREKDLKFAAVLCSDCEHLQLQAKRQVVGWARESVLATRNEVPELDEKLSQLMQPSDDKLSQLIDALLGTITLTITTKCCEGLVGGSVRALTSQYRMTNKPAPKTASLYVKGVTHPLKMAMATGSDRSSQGFLMCLSEAHRIKAVNDIITAVSTKYQELVLELFANVKKLGQTLRKLQKGSADGLSGGGMSDDDKIYLQVFLDVNAVASSLKEMDARYIENEALKSLYEVAKSVCTERGIDLPEDQSM